MEVDLAAAGNTDEPVALSGPQIDDAAGGRDAVLLRRPGRVRRAGRRDRSNAATRRLRHGGYQRGSRRRGPPPNPPPPPLRVGFGRASFTVRLRPPY